MWKDKGLSTDLIEADHEPEPFLKPYYPKKYTSEYDISSEEFEIIASDWPHQVLTLPSINLLPDNMDWLVNSGSFDAINHGDIKLEKLV